MELELKYITIPRQKYFSSYYIRLKEIIDEKEILRWYIAKFDDENAYIEIVLEKESKNKT
jgi:hypothetical protein